MSNPLPPPLRPPNSLFKYLLLGFLFVGLLALGVFGLAVRRYLQQRNLRIQDSQIALRKDIRITLVEGLRREEMAAQLAAAGVCEYQEFLSATETLEGYLFPDTYRFFPKTPATEVAAALYQNFQEKTGGLNLTKDQLILASILEREAKTDDERYLIAGVYTNRLVSGTTLDADPTVQYGKESLAYSQTLTPENFKFWQPITQADYRSVKSIYNTYEQPGLPPTPIANPGKKSILAAQSPTNHAYFYFLHRDGKLFLSKTLTEHINKQ